MKILKQLTFFMCLPLISTITMAQPEVPEHFELLTKDFSENLYSEYNAYLDKKSVKKVGKDKALFNMIVFGLDVDREAINPIPQGSNPPEIEDLSNSRVVLINEMNCNTKNIKPIKYITLDLATGEKLEIEPNEDDVSPPTTDADKLIIDRIYNLVCN